MNQIEQLKEDIGAKDRAIVAEQFEASSVAKRLEQRAHEVEALKRLLDESNTNAARGAAEISELSAALRESEAAALTQKRA
jgi:hypothetical protein